MKVVTSREMREIDRITIEDYGIPSLVLMERAGLAVALKIKELYPPRKVIVLCGGGNNGGDGLVAARNLHNWGFRVKVTILSEEARLSPDCSSQYQIAKKTGIPMRFGNTLKGEDIHGALVIDAVLGTGLARPVTGDLAEIFRLVNGSNAPVLSVDIASGISSDTGEVLGEAIRATHTVTFGLPKRGHFLYPGAAHSGRLFVEDIGFPQRLLTAEGLKVELFDRERASALIHCRPKYSHKGDYGHVLVIAGSRGKTGAALLVTKSCLRTGSGLVTLGIPESLIDVFQGRVTDEMTLSLPDDGHGMLSSRAADAILEFAFTKIDAIAIGPGLGISSDTGRILAELMRKSPVPMVIDADGINSIKGGADVFRTAKSPLLLTPHPGEMRRLIERTGFSLQDSAERPPAHSSPEGEHERGTVSIRDIEKNRIDMAMEFAKETGAHLALKGVPTVVATPGGKAFLNTSGNPGMATGGSGDVLTGIIASLVGQRLNPAEASTLGVYLHGLAGDEAFKEKGEYSLIASDIIDYLPRAFRVLSETPIG